MSLHINNIMLKSYSSLYFTRLLVLCVLWAMKCEVEAWVPINAHYVQIHNSMSPSTPLLAVHQSQEEFEELSVKQISAIRKEASKRMARRQLAQVFLSPEQEDSIISVIPDILKKLEQDSLLQIRGISKSDPKIVKVTAERFAVEIEQALTEKRADAGRVFLAHTKGHAALYFLANQDNSGIPIFTTGKVNAWTKREKAPRDIYGQIISEEAD